MFNILQYKKEDQEMLGFAECSTLKSNPPNQEDDVRTEQDNMAADPDNIPGDQ
jgi:hypothetical protein